MTKPVTKPSAVYYQEGDDDLGVTVRICNRVVRISTDGNYKGVFGYQKCRIRVLELPVDDPYNNKRVVYFGDGRTWTGGIGGVTTRGKPLRKNSKNVIGIAYESEVLPAPHRSKSPRGKFITALAIAEKMAGIPTTRSRLLDREKEKKRKKKANGS